MSKSGVRVEKDSFGNIDVPGEHYWGAQTERSRGNFKIGMSSSDGHSDRVGSLSNPAVPRILDFIRIVDEEGFC